MSRFPRHVVVFARVLMVAFAFATLFLGRSAQGDQQDQSATAAEGPAAPVAPAPQEVPQGAASAVAPVAPMPQEAPPQGAPPVAPAAPPPAAPSANAAASDSAVVVPVVSPAAPASASATTSAAASSQSRPAAAEVKVRDKVVFTFRASRGDRSPADRAKAAQAALDGLLSHGEQLGEVRFEEAQGAAVVFVGATPVFTLGPEDVEASGEANLGVLTAQVTARVSDAVSSEKKRSAIATTVFSVSLLVFSALIAFWLLGRASDLADKLRNWMSENPERLAAIRLGKIELVSAGAARGGTSIALTLGYRLTQLAIGYAWLIFGLSLFESTRGYTEKLTGLMLTPLYALASRIGSGLPVFLVAGIALLAVSVLIRFVGLFFDSVGRGDTKITWLARDLAQPTSTLVRASIIVTSLVLASPLITGESDGVLSRVGLVALVAVALASTPLLASAAVGAVVIYGRRLKKGELVEFGGRAGRVNEVGLLDVRLEDAGACDIRVPHFLGLVHPTRVHRHPPLGAIDVIVDPKAPQAEVEKGLLEAARSISSRGRVELVYLDGLGAHWRVHSATHRGDTTLGRAVQDALTKLGVGLGTRGADDRAGRPPPRSGEGTSST
ncbi:MAG TPA: mechanosensitive ion channel family protein [Labilithrix sp.]|nr:mechanosensitive ion channel family protein [Labilithrix sp.]